MLKLAQLLGQLGVFLAPGTQAGTQWIRSQLWRNPTAKEQLIVLCHINIMRVDSAA